MPDTSPAPARPSATVIFMRHTHDGIELLMLRRNAKLVFHGGACTVDQGDASFDHSEIDRPGPRHRLYMLQSGWRYENTL